MARPRRDPRLVLEREIECLTAEENTLRRRREAIERALALLKAQWPQLESERFRIPA
jgi:hypothetical protein